MKFISTNISDVIIIEPKVYQDDRGYFFETFRQDLFKKKIGAINFVQDNESKSSYGVLRGLHYQLPPYAQAKLVRVVKGEVLDVAVDIRKNSSTFGKYIAVKLSDKNKRQLFIPHGFAHGFLTLSKEAVFAYKCDNYYNKESEGSIHYKDPKINIDWGIDVKDCIVSDKDSVSPLLKNAKIFE